MTLTDYHIICPLKSPSFLEISRFHLNVLPRVKWLTHGLGFMPRLRIKLLLWSVQREWRQSCWRFKSSETWRCGGRGDLIPKRRSVTSQTPWKASKTVLKDFKSRNEFGADWRYGWWPDMCLECFLPSLLLPYGTITLPLTAEYQQLNSTDHT
jgi:hypothetical protein